MGPGRVQRSYSSTTRYGRAGFLHLQWKRKRSNGVLQQLPNMVPLLMVTRTASVLMRSIGIPEEEADHATGFICEFCSFEDPKGFG